MIKWVKEKFASVTNICFIVYVIAVSVFFGILGKTLIWQNPNVGFTLGLLIGIALGIFSGILNFGLITTILDISQSNDCIAKKLDDISSKLEKTDTSSSKNNDASI